MGAWNKRRADADVSGPLNASGTLRGRVTAAAQDGDSYLDRYSLVKRLFGATLEFAASPDTRLSLGHSQQHNRPKGVLWGALPLFYADDGTPTSYPVSASPAPSWTYWNSDDVQTFGELTQRLAGAWQASARLTRRVLESDAELFFVSGNPERASGSGMSSWPSKYRHAEKQWIADLALSGPFRLGGRQHELALGWGLGRSSNELRSSEDDGSLPLSESDMLAGNFPRPAFDQGVTGSASFSNRRSTLYAMARGNLSQAVKLITGSHLTRASSEGVQYGLQHAYRHTRATPHVGATWALDVQHTLYASHGGIFNPQHQLDQTGALLPPIKGSNTELGAKGEWMEGRLNAALALFRVRQDNTAEAAGFKAVTNQTYYRGIDAASTGFEIDLGGRLAPGWEASGGYTQLRIEAPDGTPVRTYVPRKTLRFSSSYRLPAVPALQLGANLKWQSHFERLDGSVSSRQGAFALLYLVASYRLGRQLSLSGKLENATDKKYLTSLMWPNQGYHGTPRNLSVSLRWTY